MHCKLKDESLFEIIRHRRIKLQPDLHFEFFTASQWCLKANISKALLKQKNCIVDNPACGGQVSINVGNGKYIKNMRF